MQTQDAEVAICDEGQRPRNGWVFMRSPDIRALAPTLPVEACQLTIDRSDDNPDVVVSFR